jgi:glycosyltransferase involved in cell wall biosynthesis
MGSLSIYHDALLQNGGAEKVAVLWAKEFNSPLNVLAQEQKSRSRSGINSRVHISWIRSQKVLELTYPFLPIIFPFLKRYSEDVRLVSTTGLAHHFKGNWNKRILYIHSPARWIWDAESFNIGRNKVQILLANFLRPFFKIYDRKAIRKNDVILVRVSLPSHFEKFFLQVGRVRGYKGHDFLIEVFRESQYKLILVGEGTEKIQEKSILGLGFVSESELAWLYQSAQALLAVSKEDFGLTPVEAAIHGCPTIAFKQNGYLDSVREGISGEYVTPEDIFALKQAIAHHDHSKYELAELQKFAREFSVKTHISILEKLL